MTSPMDQKQPTFEQHLGEVERAIRKLESGDIPLEDSIDLYAEAMAHLKSCHTVLDRAEKRLEIVRKSVEGHDEAGPADVGDDGVKAR
jgi:exodeoxyribonuclease VII small subunit